MPVKEKIDQINLLPQKEFETSTLGRILKWALSTFRVIVILTEMIVMIAFLSRFWLDAKNNDLSDSIRRKTAVIAAQLPFEADFRKTQQKLNVFSSVVATSTNYSDLVNSIAALIPSNIILTAYEAKGSEIKIAGSAVSEFDIDQLITNLSASEKFSDVNLTSVGVNQENETLVNFAISLFTKPQAKIN